MSPHTNLSRLITTAIPSNSITVRLKFVLTFIMNSSKIHKGPFPIKKSMISMRQSTTIQTCPIFNRKARIKITTTQTESFSIEDTFFMKTKTHKRKKLFKDKNSKFLVKMEPMETVNSLKSKNKNQKIKRVTQARKKAKNKKNLNSK